MKKRLISTLLSLVLVLGLTAAQTSLSIAIDNEMDSVFDKINYNKTSEVRVILDGEQLVFEVDPTILQGRTLVPMRGIFEALGLKVGWDEVNGIATGATSGIIISFTIGSNKVIINDEEKIIDVPAKIIDGRTMIPLRFLSENMDYNVVWIGSSNLILLSKGNIIEWRYDGYETIAPYKEYENKYVNGERTSATRYTGTNHEVKFVYLYSADGRLIPNVPDFNIAHYGTGWYLESPFTGKTYWINLDKLTGLSGNIGVYDTKDFGPIESNLLRTSSATGNYIKVKVEEHFFDLNIWSKMSMKVNPELNGTLDGEIINSEDTILRVSINDQYDGYILLSDLLSPLLDPEKGDIYTFLTKDPRLTFKWQDEIWQRLKGENPWTGMTKDMLLVQKLKVPDKSTKLNTRFTTFELLVYEHEYVDSVYLFDNGVLNSMW